MGVLDTALVQEVARLRKVAEAQLVEQRETNRLLRAIAAGQNPEEVSEVPAEAVAVRAKVGRGFLTPRY